MSDFGFEGDEEEESEKTMIDVKAEEDPVENYLKFCNDIAEDISEQNIDYEQDEDYYFVIYNEQTSSTAINFIETQCFNLNYFLNKNLIEIHFIIKEFNYKVLEVESTKIKRMLNDKFNLKTNVIIVFKSTVSKGSRSVYFRFREDSKIIILQFSEDIDSIIFEYAKKFFIGEIKKGRTGILKKSENNTKLHLLDIGSYKERNLLMISIIRKDYNIFQKLLKHGFDIDYEDSMGYYAIEIAWIKYINTENIEDKVIYELIILDLLNENSKFPYDFNIEQASDKIKNLVHLYEKLHKYVEYEKFDELKNDLSTCENLNYVYDRRNQSLIAHALSQKKFKIHAFLMSKKMSTGYHEINNLEEIFSKYEKFELKHVRDKSQQLSEEIPKTHILVLQSRSRIASNDRKVSIKIDNVENAFKTIDKQESCSEVLKVVATSRELLIFFDFKNDSAYYLDPTSSKYTKGITYSSGKINIGAKDLVNDSKQYEVFGVMIHELCHLAILMTFMNNFDPFPMGESARRLEFENEIIEQCRDMKNFEPIIKNVFDCYIEEHYASELIVVVLQIFMHYHKNDQYIQSCIDTFPYLFKYFKEYVLVELQKAVDVLKKLFDKADIKYEILTDPMKAKILNSVVKFQGIETTLNNIVGSDHLILDILPSDDIKECLLNNKQYKIGTGCKTSTKYEIIERKFVEYEANSKHTDYNSKIKSTPQIQEKIAISKIFVLADTAGAGKSITFEYLTKSLKDNNKEYWVSYIKLRSYREIFEKYHKKENFNAEKLLKVLLEILNIKLKIEKLIFKKLYYENKVILLFDGVDEVSSKYNTFLINLLQLFKNSRNQLWISTRPQHIRQLTNELNVNIFKLVPYTKDDKSKFIADILRKSGETNETKINEVLKSFDIFFESIKKDNYSNYTEVVNPLMIRIIVELYINGKIDLKSMSFELFETYEKIIDKLSERTNEERRGDDNDSFLVNFTIVHVHEVLALIFLFYEQDNGFRINELSIIKKWSVEKLNWKVHKIQHFGFITTNSDNHDDGSFDFTHYTFAEFFVAKFIIWYLYQSDDDIKDEEFKKIFEFIREVALRYDFKNVLSFIFSYLRDHSRTYQQLKIKRYVVEELENIRDKSDQYYHNSRKILKFFSVLLVRELDTLRLLWQTSENQNFLRKILTKENYFENSDLADIFEILEISFKCDWHKEFNKSGIDLISSADITNDMGENNYCPDFNRNVIKFIDLIEKNYKTGEIESIYINRFSRKNFVEQVNENSIRIIIDKSILIFATKEELLLNMLASFISLSSDENVFMFLGENIERILNSTEEKIKKVLFSSKNCDFMYPLCWAVKMKNAEIFRTFKNLYLNYTSFDEIINKLKTEPIILKLFSNLSNETYEIFKQFMNELFTNNKDQFIECISGDISEIIMNKEKFETFEKFLTQFFDKNNNLVKNCIKKGLFIVSNHEKHPLLKVIENNDSEKLSLAINLYKKFNESLDEVRQMFITNSIIFPIFNFNIEDTVYECLKQYLLEVFESDKEKIAETINDEGRDLIDDEHKFKRFKKFTEEFFNNDQAKVNSCIQKILSQDYDPDSHVLLEILTKNDVKEFDRVKDLYLEYLTVEELQDIFTSKLILVAMLLELTQNIFESFKGFIAKVFVNNKQKLSESINDKNGYKLIECNEKFEMFETFLRFVLKTDSENNYDNTEFRKCIRKVLFFDYDEIFHPLVLVLKTNDRAKFEEFRTIYSKYKDSWEEIQKNFMSEKIFVSLFADMTDDMFAKFKEFALEIFESDKKKLHDFFTDKNNFRRVKISALAKHKNKYIQKFVMFACESVRN